MAKSPSNSAAVAADAPKKRGRPRKTPQPQVVAAKDAGETFEELTSLFGEEPIKVVPLEDQSYEELYNKAVNIYRIPVTKDYTKGDIIDAIRRKKDGRRVDVAIDARDVNEIPPGWAKVQLFKDNSPKASNRPQYFMVGGYRCTVPFGIPVLIPLKVLEVLQNAVESRRVEDNSVSNRNSDASRFKTVEVHRFPFSVLGQTPGPDPRPVLEKMKAINLAPREAYRDYFGRWPTNAELRVAIQDGVVKLNQRRS
jgi:hypothetical protein